MSLNGYKHYISAIILLAFALTASMDPSAMTAVVAFFAAIGIPVGGPTILAVSAVLVIILKQLQNWADS